jgi:cobalt/nickel transport system permease protein
MHLGNAALTPECAVITLGAAAGGLGLAAFAARREPVSSQKLALAGALGLLVFAAQAINVPILPGTSAHLVGGVLLAWTLGPGLGAWTMAVVLLVQALALGDGGLSALGANVLNMALLPAGLVALARRVKVTEGRSSWAWPGMLAALSIPLAAGLIVGETALFRSTAELSGWLDFAVRMIGSHLLVGLGEGGVTIALCGLVSALNNETSRERSWRPAWIGLCLAALLGVATLSSSPLPDAYEASAQRAQLDWLLAE